MTTPTDVVTTYFSALANGDVPTAIGQLSPHLVWHQPGANRFSGDHHGPEGFGALIGAMMEATAGSFTVAPTGPVMANGDLVAVPVHFSGRSAQQRLDMPGVDLLRVEDDQIVEVWLFSRDAEAEDEFWGR